MNCKQTYKLLSDFIDKELPIETYDKIKNHLAICPHCHAFSDTLKMTIKLSQRQKFVIIPKEVHCRLIKFLKEHLDID
ncbi:MAG: zf-HC2 domain-containing protein [bacterium]|nr:zf-HC2 domain-containing protein [bacterium]